MSRESLNIGPGAPATPVTVVAIPEPKEKNEQVDSINNTEQEFTKKKRKDEKNK